MGARPLSESLEMTRKNFQFKYKLFNVERIANVVADNSEDAKYKLMEEFSGLAKDIEFINAGVISLHDWIQD